MDSPHRPALLVSVRSAAEAQAAHTGGADIIDIKEPARGSLGMANISAIREIIHALPQDTTITAALGELRDTPNPPHVLPDRLTLAKVGLAGESSHKNWPTRLNQLRDQLTTPLIAVAYADHKKVDAPSPQDILHWANTTHAPAILIDTAIKDDTRLLDHLPLNALRDFIDRAHTRSLPVALAGSLNTTSITSIATLGADVLAVRGAACARNDRNATICADRVRALQQIIASATSPQVAVSD